MPAGRVLTNVFTFIVNIFGDTMLSCRSPSSCEHSGILSDFTFSTFKNNLWPFVDQEIFQLFADFIKKSSRIYVINLWRFYLLEFSSI